MEPDLFCVCGHPACPECETRELIRRRDERLQAAADDLTPSERHEAIRRMNGNAS